MLKKVKEAVEWQEQQIDDWEAKPPSSSAFYRRKRRTFSAEKFKETLRKRGEEYKFCITLRSLLVYPDAVDRAGIKFCSIPHKPLNTTHWLFPTEEEMRKFLRLTQEKLKE